MLSEVYILAICYFSRTLPLNLIYLSIVFKTAGGGGMVLSAMVHAIISDVLDPERRGRAFFYLASMMLITEMVVPILGSALMERWNAFAPLIMGFPFELTSLIVLVMIPNTVKLATRDSEETPLLEDINATEGSENTNQGTHNTKRSLKTTFSNIVAPLIVTWTLIFRSRNLLLVNLSFLVTTLGRETLDFLVQYTSKRFGWSLAKVCVILAWLLPSLLLEFSLTA